MGHAGNITVLAIGGAALGGAILLSMLKEPPQVQAAQVQKGSVFTSPAVDERRPGTQTTFPERKVVMDIPLVSKPLPVSLVPLIRKRPVQPEPIVSPTPGETMTAMTKTFQNIQKEREELKILPNTTMTSQTEPVAIVPRIPGPLTTRPKTLQAF